MQVLRLHGHTVIERPQMLFKSCLSRFGTRLSGLLVKKVKFKFLDGEGLCAIVMDGCKPQIEGLGRDLV